MIRFHFSRENFDSREVKKELKESSQNRRDSTQAGTHFNIETYNIR